MLPRPRHHSRGLLESDDVALCGCSRCEGDPSISSSSVGQPEVARRKTARRKIRIGPDKFLGG